MGGCKAPRLGAGPRSSSFQAGGGRAGAGLAAAAGEDAGGSRRRRTAAPGPCRARPSRPRPAGVAAAPADGRATAPTAWFPPGRVYSPQSQGQKPVLPTSCGCLRNGVTALCLLPPRGWEGAVGREFPAGWPRCVLCRPWPGQAARLSTRGPRTPLHARLSLEPSGCWSCRGARGRGVMDFRIQQGDGTT